MRALLRGAAGRTYAHGSRPSSAGTLNRRNALLDTYLDELNAEVLRPMGFGWDPEGAEPTQGEAPAPSIGANDSPPSADSILVTPLRPLQTN
jgi:hypothetical protein